MHQNVAITGLTGVRKTYADCALAQQVSEKATGLSTDARLLARLARIDVLVIDDWGLVPVAERERRDLLEIIEDRYRQRSTVLCSQLLIEKWHDQLGDPTVADAICDRLLHNGQRIVLEGESSREPITQN